MNNPFIYPDGNVHTDYSELSEGEKLLALSIYDILFEVQYAKPGFKTKVRRDTAVKMAKTMKTAYYQSKP